MEKNQSHNSIAVIIFFVTVLILFMAFSKWNEKFTPKMDPTVLEILANIEEDNLQEIKNQQNKTKLLQSLISMVESYSNQENKSSVALSDFQKQVLNGTHMILNKSLTINAFQENLKDKIQRIKAFH